nr:hypothetical protein L204_02269 [Cryptococcus depauperatus CBS 7855]
MFKRTAPVPAGASQLLELKTPGNTGIPKAWLDKLATIKPPNVSVASHGGRSSHPIKEDIGDSVVCSTAQPTNANNVLLEAIVPNNGFRP